MTTISKTLRRLVVAAGLAAVGGMAEVRLPADLYRWEKDNRMRGRLCADPVPSAAQGTVPIRAVQIDPSR